MPCVAEAHKKRQRSSGGRGIGRGRAGGAPVMVDGRLEASTPPLKRRGRPRRLPRHRPLGALESPRNLPHRRTQASARARPHTRRRRSTDACEGSSALGLHGMDDMRAGWAHLRDANCRREEAARTRQSGPDRGRARHELLAPANAKQERTVPAVGTRPEGLFEGWARGVV